MEENNNFYTSINKKIGIIKMLGMVFYIFLA